MERIKNFFSRHKQIILYMLFGSGTLLINILIYTLFVEALHCGITVSNAVAWFGAAIFSFFSNKLFVFGSHRKHISSVVGEIISFFTSRAFSGALEVFAPTILYSMGVTFSVFGIRGFGAKVISCAVAIAMNYLFTKLVVFNGKKKYR